MNIDHQESWITTPTSEAGVGLGVKIFFAVGAAGLFGAFAYKLYTVGKEMANAPAPGNGGANGNVLANGRAVANRNAGENIPLQDLPEREDH
ncbi:hypothetical protein CRE_17544 [Caenorhabditis remanei]|uniref:Uncharacterized protein n=1 Tax=Caenorhabditis remanei TaxID=31234 RepID=E3NC13_CAERE|nr:hypothetical protein CRE_17544 [Caenorhabditis remanei]